MENLSQGLVIVGIGIGGVFVNLLVLMFAVMAIGRICNTKTENKPK